MTPPFRGINASTKPGDYRVGPVDQPAGAWPKPWQLDPNPPDPGEMMAQLARAPDYPDDYLLHELDIDPPDE
jgi:hypothetical protein